MTDLDFESDLTDRLRRFDTVEPSRGGPAELQTIRRRARSLQAARRRHRSVAAVAVVLVAVAVPASAATGLLDPVTRAFRQLGVSTPPGAPKNDVLAGEQPMDGGGTIRLYLPGPGATEPVKGSDCAFLEITDGAGKAQGGFGWCGATGDPLTVYHSGVVVALHVREAASRVTVTRPSGSADVAVTDGYALLPTSFSHGDFRVRATGTSGSPGGSWAVAADGTVSDLGAAGPA